MGLKAIKNRLSVLLMLTMVCSGCSDVVTRVAVQTIASNSVSYAMTDKLKPHTDCNIFNKLKGYNLCRIKRTYKVI